MFNTLAFGTLTVAGCRGGRLRRDWASAGVAVFVKAARTGAPPLPIS